MSFFALSALSNAVTSLTLAIIVLKKGGSPQKKRDFAIFCLTASLWSFSYLFWQISNTQEIAIFWCKMLTFFATFLPITQLVFIKNLLKIKFNIYFIAFLLFYSCAGAILSFSAFMVAGVRPILVFDYWPIAGSIYNFYLIIWISLILYGQYLLIMGYRKAVGQNKTFLFYLIIATFVGYFGGLTNYPLWFGYKILPWGNIFVTFYVIIFAYAVVRSQILDLKIIKTEGLLFFIFAILLVDALISPTWNQLGLRLILVALFILVAVRFIKNLLSLNEANKRLENDKKKLIKLDRMKDEFLMMATHELTTPITAIRGRLSMALDESAAGLSSDQKKYLRPAYDAVNRLNHLSQDILSVTKIDQKEMVVIPQETNLKDLIQKIVEMYAQEARLRRNIIIFKPKNQIFIMELDQRKVREIVCHLLENAIHFTENGKITIIIEKDTNNNRVVVSVLDTGIGIDKKAQNKLFSKFTQSNRFSPSNLQEQQGAGLGLYISKNLVDLMGGDIWFTSKLGEGSSFSFSLPYKQMG